MITLARTQWSLIIAFFIVAASVLALPMTQHALSAHVEQAWSPAVIQRAILDGNCQPVYTWACPHNILKVACPASPGSDLWIGLVLGGSAPVADLWAKFMAEGPAICTEFICITGFAARSSYWLQSAARDGCIEIVIP